MSPIDPINVKGSGTYRISPLRRGMFCSVWVVVALFLMSFSIGADAPSRAVLHVTAGIVLLLGAAMTPLVWYPRLKVSHRGIELRQVGWHVSADWQDVDRISYPPAFGLVLKQPLIGLAAVSLRIGRWIPAWYAPLQERLVTEGRWLPLDPFAWSWRHGMLQQDFRRYAPWLFVSDSPSGD